MRKSLRCMLMSLSLLPCAHQMAMTQDDLSVSVRGSRVLPAQQLAGVAHKCLAKYDYARRGRDERILDECLRLLRRHIADQGYLQAKVEAIEAGPAGQPDVLIQVEEGRRLLLGEVTIEGMTLCPAEYVRAMLGLRRGEPASGEVLGEWAYERLKREYDKLGYIEYSPEVTPEVSSGADENGDGVVNFTLSVDEGRQFRVGRIEFVGNHKTRDGVLRRSLLIREDEVFNGEALEASLKRLNDFGWFEELSEKDVDINSKGEEAVVDISIRVKER